ncbi:unnamed protein product [Paramecium pentaurelia]|uniref:Bromodomain associated domain-containing protein n=1 Tax=Paramecium pentaurelia TaxID=43138 RepID=A0A8S1SHP3_9CILI|nr:unnamed protein product [Paramecium pentaurelia]
MLKQSRSKEQSLGKLMKIYVAQMLLNSGVSSCQEQGINLLAEFLIKVIRKVGSNSRRLYELQGRQEGDIFHVLMALDQLSVTCTSLLQHFKKNNNNSDLSLNRLLTQVMESIYKEKYNSQEIDEQNNLRQRCQLSIQSLNQPSTNTCSLNTLLYAPVIFKNEKVQKQRKELTEKQLKEEKRKYQYQLDEDQFSKLLGKNKQKERKQELDLNPYNAPLKRKQAIKALDQML